MAKVYPKIKSITYFDEYLLVEKLSVFFNDKKVNVFIKFLKNLEFEEVMSPTDVAFDLLNFHFI